MGGQEVSKRRGEAKQHLFSVTNLRLLKAQHWGCSRALRAVKWERDRDTAARAGPPQQDRANPGVKAN